VGGVSAANFNDSKSRDLARMITRTRGSTTRTQLPRTRAKDLSSRTEMKDF